MNNPIPKDKHEHFVYDIQQLITNFNKDMCFAKSDEARERIHSEFIANVLDIEAEYSGN